MFRVFLSGLKQVQPWSSSQSLEDLQDSIQKFYSSPRHQREVTRQQLEQDKFFAALHSDKHWYRVRVNSFLDEFTVAVNFVDYGDHAMISISNLQVLRSQFRNLPMQAIKACLAGQRIADLFLARIFFFFIFYFSTYFRKKKYTVLLFILPFFTHFVRNIFLLFFRVFILFAPFLPSVL